MSEPTTHQKTDDNLLQPIPTEYSKEIFRSKSEAIFACAIDIAWAKRSRKALWSYEQFGAEKGYMPDFFVCLPVFWRKPDRKAHVPGIITWILEYKPRLPTDAYLSQLDSRFQDLEQQIKPDYFGIFCGSPFEQQDGFVALQWMPEASERWRKLHHPNINYRIFNDIWDAMPAAKGHRFDLD